MENEFLTVLELARLAQVNMDTIYKWLWLRKLPAYQPSGPGGKWLIRKEDADRFLEQRKRKPTLPEAAS